MLSWFTAWCWRPLWCNVGSTEAKGKEHKSGFWEMKVKVNSFGLSRLQARSAPTRLKFAGIDGPGGEKVCTKSSFFGWGVALGLLEVPLLSELTPLEDIWIQGMFAWICCCYWSCTIFSRAPDSLFSSRFLTLFPSIEQKDQISLRLQTWVLKLNP